LLEELFSSRRHRLLLRLFYEDDSFAGTLQKIDPGTIRMLFETEGLNFLPEALEQMEEAFEGLPAFETEVDLQRSQAVLQEAATRMWDNFPYPHPLYAGQMLKPPHPIARLAYCMAMYINPNNHALDGGRASLTRSNESDIKLDDARQKCSLLTLDAQSGNPDDYKARDEACDEYKRLRHQ